LTPQAPGSSSARVSLMVMPSEDAPPPSTAHRHRGFDVATPTAPNSTRSWASTRCRTCTPGTAPGSRSPSCSCHRLSPTMAAPRRGRRGAAQTSRPGGGSTPCQCALLTRPSYSKVFFVFVHVCFFYVYELGVVMWTCFFECLYREWC
jgi:hypothetical protein